MDASIARNTSADNLVLVIRANHFTGKIDDGYLMRNGQRLNNSTMPAVEIGYYIAANPSIKIDFLRT